jgi:hypothetical protein
MKTLSIALFCLVGLVMSGRPASALSFDLTSNHCGTPADCGAPGTIFGNVTLTQNGTTVDVTVHLNNPPYEFAKTGSADFQAFKFNATGVVLGDITVNQTVPGQTLAADTGTFNGDGTGDFAFGIICSTCGNGLSNAFTNDIVFHVASATIADLTGANTLGIVFVADVGNSTNGATGPIDNSTPSVPDGGSTAVLLGSVLLGLGVIRRRFGKN